MMARIVLTGSSGSVGTQLMERLRADGHCVFPYDIENGRDAAWPARNNPMFENVDCLINCAGINRLDWIENMSINDWDQSFDSNVKSIFMMTQCCLPALRRNKGTILNIVSSAAYTPMRTSSAYNASKAAALMLTKQMARELAPDVTVFSVSPNRLANSAMSDSVEKRTCELRGWSVEKAREYQASSLLLGTDMTPIPCLVDFLAFLLSRKDNHKYLTGCDLPYGA